MFDSLATFKATLGAPLSIEKDPFDKLLDREEQEAGIQNSYKEESRIYKWKLGRTLIEAEFWIIDYVQAGKTYKAGSLKSLDLRRVRTAE
jgi:hypothetical protein